MIPPPDPDPLTALYAMGATIQQLTSQHTGLVWAVQQFQKEPPMPDPAPLSREYLDALKRLMDAKVPMFVIVGHEVMANPLGSDLGQADERRFNPSGTIMVRAEDADRLLATVRALQQQNKELQEQMNR